MSDGAVHVDGPAARPTSAVDVDDKDRSWQLLTELVQGLWLDRDANRPSAALDAFRGATAAPASQRDRR